MTINTELWKTWEGRVADEKFPLRQWLGGSDHSVVFQTELAGETSQKAAIKLISAGENPDQQLAYWRAAAKFSHPHLLPIFNAGRCQIDGVQLLYVVTEFAEEDLSQILPQRPLTPAETADMLPPILDAVSYLHSQGYVHSAIKPANLLAAGDQLKLSTDRVRPNGAANAQPASTPYDAPETATGELSPAADVWSIGVTLVATLTQRLPANNGAAQKDPIVPNSIPEPFRSIARECLHRDVMQRCSIADIRTWRPPDSESKPVAAAVPEIPADEERPKSRLLVPGLVLLLIVALLIGWKFTHHADPDKQPTATTQESSPQASAPATAAPATPSAANQSTANQASANRPSPVVEPPTTNQPASTGAPTTDAPPVETPKQTPPRNVPEGEVVRRVLPEVPHGASRTISGTIKVQIHVDVDENGKVSSARITHPGHSAYFNRLALQAANQWEFSPERVNGQPAPSAWNLRFQFKRSGTQAFSAKAH